MNEVRVSGSWKEIKTKLKQRFPNLTDDDLGLVDGKEQRLLGQLQKKTRQIARRIKRDYTRSLICLSIWPAPAKIALKGDHGGGRVAPRFCPVRRALTR